MASSSSGSRSVVVDVTGAGSEVLGAGSLDAGGGVEVVVSSVVVEMSPESEVHATTNTAIAINGRRKARLTS